MDDAPPPPGRAAGVAQPLAGPVAEVDLGAIARNAQRLRRLAGAAPLLAAVKADAYGHGALPVARTLERAGVGWFGVATAEEALELRVGGIRGRILIFGPVPGAPERLRELIGARVDLTAADGVAAERIAAAAGDFEPARVHLKVDTGMGRLGRSWRVALGTAAALAAERRLRFEGVWTHLAVADEPAEDAFTRRQLAAFAGLVTTLEEEGIRPPLAHVANSAGLLRFPASRWDLVRPGIALYGYHASPEAAAQARAEGTTLEPALRLCAPVTFVKDVAPGTPISYGGTWTAERTTRVATVRIGYADGYPRALSNLGEACVAGVPARVAGRVCMDQIMLALEPAEEPPHGGAGAPVRVGDTAELIGGGAPAADALAARCGTIPYELLVRLGARVERRYRGAEPLRDTVRTE